LVMFLFAWTAKRKGILRNHFCVNFIVPFCSEYIIYPSHQSRYHDTSTFRFNITHADAGQSKVGGI
jgi:hypothetical protein